MSTTVGVGRSGNRRSFEAGAEAARGALEPLGGRRASVLIVFGTAGHDSEALLAGIREVTGPVPLAGCSGEGVITQGRSEESTHCVGVMAIASDELSFRTTTVRGVKADPAGCGERLAAWVGEAAEEASLLLLFIDGLIPSVMPLLARLEERLPVPVAVAGGTAGDLFQFKQTWQYGMEGAFDDGVSALLIRGPVTAELAVSHGCDLIGAEHTVTRADSGWVHEIDGRPAWAVLKEYLGPAAESIAALAVSHVCFAEFVPEDVASEPGEFIVRVPVMLDKERGALGFAAGMKEGTRMQMALRGADGVKDRALASVASLVARRPGEAPLFVLQVDCACRGALLFGEQASSALMAPLQAQVGKAVPWLGFHSYGELAPLGARTELHNYRAVFCAFYPRR